MRLGRRTRIAVTVALALVLVLALAPWWAPITGLALPALAPPQSFIDVGGGTRLHVVDEGDGPPIVLVHGLPGGTGDWTPLPERLIAAGFRVIRYDRTGYGHSSRRGSGNAHTVEANGEDLVALLRAMQLEPAVLVGWSYGGGVAQSAAAAAPEQVAGLVLVGSDGPTSPSFGGFARVFELTTPVRRWAVASGFPARIGVRVWARSFFGDAVPEWWPEYAMSVIGAPGMIDTWTAEVRDFDPSTIPAGRIVVPTTVVQGALDSIVPPAVGTALKDQIANASLVMVEDGTHMLPNTHSDLLVTEIAKLASR